MYSGRVSKREALIEAAAELLWERGYSATSPAMILRLSEAGQGSMYHHFSGKAELAIAAMQHLAGQLRSAAEMSLATEDTAIGRVSAYLDLERNPLTGCRLGRLVQDHDVVSDSQLRAPAAEFFAWLTQSLAEVLAEGVSSGELRPDTDVEAMAALAVAAVQGGYVLARALQDPRAFRQAVAGVKQALANLRNNDAG